MSKSDFCAHEVTRGFTEDITLRKRYQNEGFGLETVFEKREWAEDRISQLKENYGLTHTDVRMVKHVSTPETGEKIAWEVHVASNKGLRVLFF